MHEPPQLHKMHNPISDRVDRRKSEAGFTNTLHRPHSRANKAPISNPFLPFPSEIAPAVIALREMAVSTAVRLHAVGSTPRCIRFAASMVKNNVVAAAAASDARSLRRCNVFPLCLKEKPPLRNKMLLHLITAKGILF